MTRAISRSSRSAMSMIRAYQRYVSPYKGFVCAHRVLHHQESCSQHALRLVREQGWWKAMGLMRSRFRECRAADQTLRSESFLDRMHDESERKRKKLESLPSGEPEVADACWLASTGACACDELFSVGTCWEH